VLVQALVQVLVQVLVQTLQRWRRLPPRRFCRHLLCQHSF
jgi:hypothetical protein